MTSPRLVIGVVTPHRAPGPEIELPAVTGGRASAIVSRTEASLRASTEDPALDQARDDFRGTRIDAVAHASTTTGYAIGPREEAALVERLSAHFEVPAVAACAAAVAALRAYRIERVQLVHPPWFNDEFDALGATYFRHQGLDPVVTKAVDLPDNPAGIDPHHVVDWLEHHLDVHADALYLAGNGFQTAAALENLEQRTGRLILSANQALLWALLAATATPWKLTGHGRLLRQLPCPSSGSYRRPARREPPRTQ
jgi:maleate isomerase